VENPPITSPVAGMKREEKGNANLQPRNIVNAWQKVHHRERKGRKQILFQKSMFWRFFCHFRRN
jgi:hypothetical protein